MLLKFSLNIWCPKINENHCTCISRATNQPFRPFVARHSSNLSILLEPTRYHGIKASSRQQAVRAIVTTRYLPKRQRIARTDEIKRHPWRCTSVVVANRRVSILYRLGIISATARRKWREHPRAASLTYRRRKSPTHPRRVNPLAFPTLLFSPSSPPRGRFSAASGVTRGAKALPLALEPLPLWNTYSVSPPTSRKGNLDFSRDLFRARTNGERSASVALENRLILRANWKFLDDCLRSERMSFERWISRERIR